MNAPGDSALIIVLLAVFVACTAYAAGRLHQRWQAAQDREEAYRDGYENGTSNVFSTAVRMLGPKRSARGAAPVQTASEPDPEEAAPPAPPKKPEKADPSPRAGGFPTLGFPAPQPPPRYAITEPSAVGGVVYQQLRDPRTTDGEPPATGERPTMPPLPHPRTADHPTPHTADSTTLTPLPHPRIADRLRPIARTANTPANRDEPGDGERPEISKIREGGKGGGHRAKPPEEDTTINQAVADQTAEDQPDVSSGRHTVPDELVRATTYRLPPDRIFRAKVPENTPLPEEPTTRLPPVPKPRDES